MKIRFFILLFPLILFSAPKEPLIKEIYSFDITVEDMNRALDFYMRVLKFEKVLDYVEEGEAYEKLTDLSNVKIRIVELILGGARLRLNEFKNLKGGNIPIDALPTAHWFQHIAIVVKDMNKAFKWLQQNNVEHVINFQKNPYVKDGTSVYFFKDPDGHVLELIYFPPEKRGEKWETASNNLFLGISHGAIMMQDSKKSFQFYEHLLGMQKVEHYSYDIEEEALNLLLQSQVVITGIKAEEGPGLELIEYISPLKREIVPLGTSANDIWYWQINTRTNEIDEIYNIIKNSNQHLISRGIVPFRPGSHTYTKAFVAEDPDGHAIMFGQLPKSRYHRQNTKSFFKRSPKKGSSPKIDKN